MSYSVDLDEDPSSGRAKVSSSLRTGPPSTARTSTINGPSRASAVGGSKARQSVKKGPSFLDFGSITGEEEENVSASPTKQSFAANNQVIGEDSATAATTKETKANFTKSRFAAFANAETAIVKGVHDEIQTAMNEDTATNAEAAPKFLSMDLARLISKVIVSLHLQPSKEVQEISSDPAQTRQWLSTPENASIAELKATINMQNVLLTEMGRSVQKFSKYNQDLTEFNKKLIQERGAAIQARDDLLNILVQEQEKSKAENAADQLSLLSREREFFDEGRVIDQAMDLFRNLNMRKSVDLTKIDVKQKKPAVNVIAQQEGEAPIPIFNNSLEMVNFLADAKSIELEYQPPTDLAAIHDKKMQQTNVSANTSRLNGLSSIQHFKEVSRKVSNLNRVGIFRKMLEADSTTEFIASIEAKFIELHQWIDDALKILAEEKRNSRHWQLKCEALMSKKSESNEEKVISSSLQANIKKALAVKTGTRATTPSPPIQIYTAGTSHQRSATTFIPKLNPPPLGSKSFAIAHQL